MDPKYLIISLDFDGCSDRPFSQQEIINHIKKTCTETLSIESIYVVIGSLRQSVMLDVNNAQRNSQAPHFVSCTSLYYQFIPNLHEQISKIDRPQLPSIHFCPLLMNDIYNHLPTGTTFQAMKDIFTWSPFKFSSIRENSHEHLVDNQRGEKINVLSYTSNREIADCSKVTIIYTQLHHFAKHLETAPILMQFFDDREDILSGLSEFYTSYPEFMPENMHLQLIRQQAFPNVKPTPFTETNIVGTGSINHSYHELMYYMAQCHNWVTIPDAFREHKVIFDRLLSDTLPETHIQTFEIYPVPVQEAPKPMSSSHPEASCSDASVGPDYHDIVVPDYLPEHMSIFNLYQKITSEMRSIYMRKLKNATNEYKSNIEFLMNLMIYPEIFDLAYHLENNQRQHMFTMEICQIEMEFNDFIATHNDEYRLESECKEYASLRCNFEEQQIALKYAYDTAQYEKIKILANFLQLPPKDFIARMERHQHLLQDTKHSLVMPKPRRHSSIFTFSDDTQTASSNSPPSLGI